MIKSIQFRSFAGLIGIFVLLIAVNTFSNLFFRNFRIDLTEEKIYTLTKGSKNILKNVKDPITLKYFFSSTDASNYPSLLHYGERVKDLLNSYVKLNSKIKLEIYDPRPDSEEALWAEQYGLNGVQIDALNTLFCGLVVMNQMGDEEIIPFFDKSREQFLEYDLSKAISAVSNVNKVVCGIYSKLPLEGMPANPYMQQQSQGPEKWYFLEELTQLYEIRMLKNLEEIRDDINLLIVIHPKELTEKDQYFFDQYLLSGKNAIVLADPLCENDVPPQNPQNPMMSMSMPRNSDFPKTLTHNGFELEKGKIILERERAAQVQSAPGQITDFYAWINLMKSEVNEQDAVTGQLENLLFPSVGHIIRKIDDKTSNFQIDTLIETTQTAGLADSQILLFGGTPERITKAYTPGDEKKSIALRVNGQFKTAFPDGAPEGIDKAIADKHYFESQGAAAVVLVSDVDFISNRFALNVTNLFGTMLISPLNDNINFFYNAVESLSGSSNLTEIRSRGKFSRPFTKVQEIEQKAQKKWLDEEKALSEKLSDANSKISNLMQHDSSKKGFANQKIIDEVKKLREEKINAQRKLREVRKNLRQEKEKLGNDLFLFNTFFVPLLILFYGIYRLLIPRKKS